MNFCDHGSSRKLESFIRAMKSKIEHFDWFSSCGLFIFGIIHRTFFYRVWESDNSIVHGNHTDSSNKQHHSYPEDTMVPRCCITKLMIFYFSIFTALTPRCGYQQLFVHYRTPNDTNSNKVQLW